jgi:hypothetical protein
VLQGGHEFNATWAGEVKAPPSQAPGQDSRQEEAAKDPGQQSGSSALQLVPRVIVELESAQVVRFLWRADACLLAILCVCMCVCLCVCGHAAHDRGIRTRLAHGCHNWCKSRNFSTTTTTARRIACSVVGCVCQPAALHSLAAPPHVNDACCLLQERCAMLGYCCEVLPPACRFCSALVGWVLSQHALTDANHLATVPGPCRPGVSSRCRCSHPGHHGGG